MAVAIDPRSRLDVGWSMQAHMEIRLVLAAQIMAVQYSKPKISLIIHSNQGSQASSDKFARWRKDNKLSQSMSGRGKYWDNEAAESFLAA